MKAARPSLLFFLPLLLVVSFHAPAEAAPRRPAPVVELLTMGKGELVWERWGHVALCLRYPDPRRDACYNYGTTNFGDPVGLGWGFITGDPVFWVSRQAPDRVLRDYIVHDRTVWRQRIPLEPAAARALERKVLENLRPENRHYVYHHFDDNCSTRIRDLLDEASGGALSAASGPPPGPTFRDYADAGFAGIPALILFSDLFLGRPADRHPNEYELGFLPDALRSQVTEVFGAPPEVIYERRGPPPPDDPGLARLWWLVVALLIVLPAAGTRLLGKYDRLGLALSVLPLSLLGLAVWGLALLSDMPELRFNEVLYVFMPWDIVLPFLGVRARVGYARARVVFLLLLSLLAAAGVLTQPLYPLILVAILPHLVASLRGDSQPTRGRRWTVGQRSPSS